MIIFDSRCRKYYHAPLMSGPDAVYRLEDPFAFARAGGSRSGVIAIAAMPRLLDRVADTGGTVSYELRGRLDQRQRPLLELEVAGTAHMRCDRCLAPLDFLLKLASKVLIAEPGAAQPEDADDPETPEWIEAGQELDVLELVEDEILLGLPYSVRHGDGKCSDWSAEGGRGGKVSPFSALASLLDPEQTNKD
ncbi:MAG: DUF177 domain-containing protein [Burkholderiales bacterium]|nr:DUF177 domain-containing protein [Burkholderiales bacterium]